MGIRKGGIGPRPGRRRSCNQKRVSATSATAKSMKDSRLKREAKQKKIERSKRRVKVDKQVDPDVSNKQIAAEEALNRRLEALEQEVLALKAAARTNKANYRRALNARQEKVELLEEMVEDQCKERLQEEECHRRETQRLKDEFAESKRETRRETTRAIQDTRRTILGDISEKNAIVKRRAKACIEKERKKAKAAIKKERNRHASAIKKEREKTENEFHRNVSAIKKEREKTRTERRLKASAVKKEKEKTACAIKKEKKKTQTECRLFASAIKKEREKAASAIKKEREKTQTERRLKSSAIQKEREKTASAIKKERDKTASAIQKEKENTENERRLKALANSRARKARRSLKKSEELSSSRLEKIKALKEERDQSLATLEELKVELNDASHPVFTIGKVRKEGSGRGGPLVWPLNVLQLVLEQLVNGTPPSAVSANTASHAALAMPGVEVKVEKLPELRCIQQSRTVLRIIGETLAAHRLGKALGWEQLFTDGTGRRQIALQNLVISILEDEKLRPLTLSASIILKGETAEEQVDAVLSTIEGLGKRLQRWAEVTERLHPSFKHDIPGPTSMNIGKLGSGGAVTSDTCNAARKTKRLLVNEVETAAVALRTDNVKVEEIDCFHHLRNIWLEGMIKALSMHLSETMREELEAIDPRLRVTTSMLSLLRAIDKEFSLCANYAKGDGAEFGEWMKDDYPGVLLFAVTRATGARQDLCVEGAGAVYMNRKYYVKYLDKKLQNGDNVLRENLFIILTSLQMTALARVCSIMYMTIGLHARWLAGKCHTLEEHNFSVRSMGRMVDMLEAALVEISEDGSLLLNEAYMMGIFEKLIDELPPFAAYLSHMFEKKSTHVVGDSNVKEVMLARLRDEAFSPEDETNVETSAIAAELAVVAAKAILAELRDEKKATSQYLSSIGGKYSWDKTSKEDHAASLGKMAVNDPSEKTFGTLTDQLQKFGKIGLANAGGVSQVKVNGDLSRGYNVNSSNKAKGLFHILRDELTTSLLVMGQEDASSVRAADNVALAKQLSAKTRKAELIREKNLAAASEKLIDAYYYKDMHSSQACWKSAKKVDEELRKLSSKSAKLEALKENIRIRVIGLGWDEYKTPWSKDGRDKTPAELAAHLKMIISKERKRSIPSEPPVIIPTRKVLPQLGMRTPDLDSIDAARLAARGDFAQKARRVRLEREAVGVGDRYACMQPTSAPAVDSQLVGKRLDVCHRYILEEGGTELRWSQGEVILVSNGSNILKPGARSACYKAGEAVVIRWDANEARNEQASESSQRLLKTKWNPMGEHSDGSWRLDVEVSSR